MTMKPSNDLILVASVLLIFGAACGSVQSRSPSGPPAGPPVPEQARSPIETQILARVQSQILRINGAVQGARRLTGPGRLRVIPRVVTLIRGIRPRPQSALVVPLGTGQTVDDLAESGFRVTAAAPDTKVVQLARRYFGFRGHNVSVQRMEQIAAGNTTFDLVLWEAPRHNSPSVLDDDLQILLNTMSRKSVLLVRLMATPADPVLTRLVTKMGRTSTLILGSGIGDEMQNLFLVHAEQPVKLGDPPGLWPVTLPDERGSSTVDLIRTGRDDVSLIGYLFRETTSGALALDLPRWSKGAVRYLLVGKKAKQLERLLPRGQHFPTRGHISSDGDTRRTARSVLGGGEVPFSDTRFSPVVIEIRGRVKLLYVVGPQAASDRRLDLRLPYGGSLFRLEVTQVVAVVTERSWREFATAHRALIKQAETAIERGELTRAAAALGRYLQAARRRFGATTAARMQALDEVKRQQETLAREGALLTVNPSVGSRDNEIGRTCDRAMDAAGYPFTRVGDSSLCIQKALRRCAESRYQRVALRAADESGIWTASRLRQLWQERLASLSGQAARQLRHEIDELERRYERRLTDVDPPTPLPALEKSPTGFR
jgi:hypothetical protein